jgi:hypothetical protein
MPAEDTETLELLRQVGNGDEQALDTLLLKHRERLRRMVSVRTFTT